MSTKLMLRIGKECENVTHIKESSGDIRKARDLVRQSEGLSKSSVVLKI